MLSYPRPPSPTVPDQLEGFFQLGSGVGQSLRPLDDEVEEMLFGDGQLRRGQDALHLLHRHLRERVVGSEKILIDADDVQTFVDHRFHAHVESFFQVGEHVFRGQFFAHEFLAGFFEGGDVEEVGEEKQFLIFGRGL